MPRRYFMRTRCGESLGASLPQVSNRNAWRGSEVVKDEKQHTEFAEDGEDRLIDLRALPKQAMSRGRKEVRLR